MENRFKISPPWVTYMNELHALFGEDPDIKMEYDNDNYVVRLYVNDPHKYEALDTLLPESKWYGGVCLSIELIPANSVTEDLGSASKTELFEACFKNNPVFSFVYEVEGIFSNSITYVVFKNKVVQFFNDNLNDVYGNMNTLYQNVAEDVFDELEGVFYCTDVPEGDNVDKPLGE